MLARSQAKKYTEDDYFVLEAPTLASRFHMNVRVILWGPPLSLSLILYTDIYIYHYVCVCLHMYKSVCAYIQVHLYIYIYIYTHAYIHIYVYLHMQTLWSQVSDIASKMEVNCRPMLHNSYQTHGKLWFIVVMYGVYADMMYCIPPYLALVLVSLSCPLSPLLPG